MARARQKTDGRKCRLHFRDAALTNGIPRGDEQHRATTKKFIGILNDNEWSIAKNVGAISGYLNKLITNPRYNKLAKDFENLSAACRRRSRHASRAQPRRRQGAISEAGMHQKSDVAFSGRSRRFRQSVCSRNSASVISARLTTQSAVAHQHLGICEDVRSSDCHPCSHAKRKSFEAR